MELRRTDGPVGDPFFDTVRARHPDVDVVVLPPEPAAPPGPPRAPLPAEQALDRRTADASFAEALWQRVVEEPAELRHTVSGGAGSARWQSVGSLPGTADGFRVLVRLTDALAHDPGGWVVRRRDGAVALLVARDAAGRTLTTSYAEQTGVLVFRLSSGEHPVTAEALAALRGEG